MCWKNVENPGYGAKANLLHFCMPITWFWQSNNNILTYILLHWLYTNLAYPCFCTFNTRCMGMRGNYGTYFVCVCVCVLVTSLSLVHDFYTQNEHISWLLARFSWFLICRFVWRGLFQVILICPDFVHTKSGQSTLDATWQFMMKIS